MKIQNSHTGRPFTAFCLLISLLFGVSKSAYSQLVKEPLERQGVSKSAPKQRSSSNGRTQSEPLGIPFWDDFSTTRVYDPNIETSGYPRSELWYDSYNVWISEGIEIKAPSLNVATFDGLDSAGIAYSSQILENGFRDTLTSQPIDLSTTNVTLQERPTVFLSFFYQWRGNGEAPDNNDFLRLEFFNKDSLWIPIATKYGSNEEVNDTFTKVMVQLLEDQFFHDHFMFRFRDYGNKSGPYDGWNLDYIFLDKNRSADDAGFPDRALASGLTQIFGRYRSVPLEHYRVSPVYTTAQIEIQNSRAGTEGSPTDILMDQTFMNYVDGVLTKVEKPFGPIGSKYPNNFLLPGERVTSLLKTDVDPIDFTDPTFDFNSYFLPDADSIDLKVTLDIYEPDAGFYRSNDTLSTTFRLNDYYAYDDGTAEYTAKLNQSDDQVALGFDLLTVEPQELVGFDIYIPQYGINGYTTVTFFVMDSENGEPNTRLGSLTHVVSKNSRDAFQTITFDPILVSGRFFIGWKGSSAAPLKVGLDYSNNTTDLIYEDLTGVMENGKLKWFPASSLSKGTLMIRPNFGAPTINTGIVKEKIRINYYPNPNKGSFYIEGSVEDVEVFSMSGQKIQVTKQNEGERFLISLPDVQPGLYILKARKGAGVVTEKIIVGR